MASWSTPSITSPNIDDDRKSVRRKNLTLFFAFWICCVPQRGRPCAGGGFGLRGQRQALFPKRAWTKRGKGGEPPFAFPQVPQR